MDCPLAANPEEFITRAPSMSMRSQWHKINISRTTVRKYVAGGLEVQILWYDKRPILLEAGKRMQNGSRRTSRRCEIWRSGLPAHLTTAFWTILCGASLAYWSLQSLTTKSRASSKR
jgi:hypothetical protein